MLIAGLTGGMGCGKTFVASALRDLGCYVIEADDLGREVMLPGGPAYAAIIAEFGKGIVGEDGAIVRSRLASIVFSDPPELVRLNAIVHPAVHKLAHQRFREIESHDPRAIVIYVAAILVETGGYREFPRLIVVACRRQQQIERALQRPGAKLSDILARLERQLPLGKKKELADYVIDASGTIEKTLRQTKMVFNDLKKQAS
ncbi:MAG: dephospho-CoA kinase [Bryobacterales bacterium]|jgi:dephospho-CoA kinase|nr:dephospho-CoA kinase [Bryobacterales bacterium]